MLRMQTAEDPTTYVVLAAFWYALATKASVRSIQNQVVVQILDMDEVTTPNEVVEAIFLTIDADIQLVSKPTLHKG